jgi:hypothetical protein
LGVDFQALGQLAKAIHFGVPAFDIGTGGIGTGTRGRDDGHMRQLLAAKRESRNRGSSFLPKLSNSDQMSGSRAAALREFLLPHTIFMNNVEGSEKPSTYHILYVRHLLLQPVVGATVYRVTNARQQISDFASQLLLQ